MPKVKGKKKTKDQFVNSHKKIEVQRMMLSVV